MDHEEENSTAEVLNSGEESVQNDDSISEVTGDGETVNEKNPKAIDNNNSVDIASDAFVWVGPKRPTKNTVWKSWGFKRFSKNKVDYDKVYCKLCNHSVNYKGSSTNMKTHLNTKHKNDVTEIDVTQPRASQFFEDKQPRKQKYPKHHPINKKARAALVKWFCKRDRPFRMTEDPEFSEFCAILDPKFDLPSKQTVTRDMEATYKVEKAKLIQKLKKVHFLHGTNDGGSAINGEAFVSNTVHYVDPDTWKLEHAILGCTVMEEAHSAVNYRDHIDATEEVFEIKGKVIGYTTDNENKMHSAFRNDERNGCIAHIQSKTMEKAVAAVNCISLVRKKMRKLARLGKFPKFKYALKEAQKSRELPQRKILQEVKTRFTSTLTMCHSVMSFDLQKSKEEILQKAKINREAINDALDKVGTKKAKKLKLKESEVEMIIATANVLEPICDMLTMLGGEKFVTGSIVLPYMKKVVYLIRVEETDPKFIVDFKNFIIRDFLQRCRENLNFDLLKKATFLDPRFKSMKSIDQSQLEELKEEIKFELASLAGQDQVETKENPKKESKKRKRISLESDDEEDNDDFTVAKELEKYINEPKLHEDSDPLLDFWKIKKTKYPRLSILAKKYLSVQATSTPSERIFSKMGNVVNKKRNRITSAHTNETIFLSDRL